MQKAPFYKTHTKKQPVDLAILQKLHHAINGLSQCSLYVLNFNSQNSQPIQPLRMGFEVLSSKPGWERLASIYRGFCCLWFWEYFSIFSKEILLMRPEHAQGNLFQQWLSRKVSAGFRITQTEAYYKYMDMNIHLPMK